MNEVGFKAISNAGFNRDSLKKPLNSQYSKIPESTLTNHNTYKISHIETKEILHLKKDVNRLERNISFIQQEHSQMLKGLQQQIEQLRDQNQELQFQIVMRSGHTISPDDPMLQLNVLNANKQITNDVNSESISSQILKLKESLEVEKAKNNELILKLDTLTMERAAEEKPDIPEVEPDSQRESTAQNKVNDEIDISPNVRISLDPLTLSLFHEASGQFITNTTPTSEDCELIIRILLDKSQYPLTKMSSGSSIRSLSAQRPTVPYIRKPLQNVKPISRNSAPIKLNSLYGTHYSKPTGTVSNYQKLAPIVSQKNDVIKIEDESNRLESGTTSAREPKHGLVNTSGSDMRSGYSLPALPKPSDFNQAEKQRRLHLLQRKRLNQYNNKL